MSADRVIRPLQKARMRLSVAGELPTVGVLIPGNPGPYPHNGFEVASDNLASRIPLKSYLDAGASRTPMQLSDQLSRRQWAVGDDPPEFPQLSRLKR